MTDSKTLRQQLGKLPSPNARRVLVQKIQSTSLKERISSCRECSLGDTRTQAVPFDGPTHGRAKIAIVGEAPGYSEDKFGRPFVGKSGMLLESCFEKLGIERKDAFIVNTLCCRPPKNRDPEVSELTACSKNFTDQLDISGCWVGVALGGYALSAIMGKPRSSIRISEYLDKPVWVNGRIWFPTYHPAYALRNPGAEADITLSIRAALATREGSTSLKFSHGSNEKTRTKETKAAYVDLRILENTGKSARDLADHLHKRGWAFGHVPGIDEHILIMEDNTGKVKKPIPRTLLDLPMYTLAELINVGLAGKGQKWDGDALRRLHLVKIEFNGEIVA